MPTKKNAKKPAEKKAAKKKVVKKTEKKETKKKTINKSQILIDNYNSALKELWQYVNDGDEMVVYPLNDDSKYRWYADNDKIQIDNQTPDDEDYDMYNFKEYELFSTNEHS